jgi:nitrate reductase NapE component
MRSRLRAALLPVLLAAAAAHGCSGRGGFLQPQYEYEEDLTLSLDGSATLVVNTSIPALVALRGFALDTSPHARLDRLTARVREVYTSQYADVLRVTQWTRFGRRFVGVRLRIPDIHALPKAAPFSWARYDLHPENGQHVFKEEVGASAFKPGSSSTAGLNGDEIVAFRLHLPSHIRYHNARDIDTGNPRTIQRGNILTWEQRLSDRLQGTPIQIEVRMDSESILYRTLSLFAVAFVAALGALGFLIWLTMRRGRASP